jgi:hypothetical protein
MTTTGSFRIGNFLRVGFAGAMYPGMARCFCAVAATFLRPRRDDARFDLRRTRTPASGERRRRGFHASENDTVGSS